MELDEILTLLERHQPDEKITNLLNMLHMVFRLAQHKRGEKMTVAEYKTRFAFIIETEMDQKEKDKMLSGLMKDMEYFFGIPEVISEEWEKENPEICALHCKIANSRLMNFEE